MTKSTLLTIAVVAMLGPIVVGCASDTAIESASFAKSRPLTAPAEFANVPNASPMPSKAANSKVASNRIVDTSIQQASATESTGETSEGQRRTRTAIARLTERSGRVEQAVAMYKAILATEPNNPKPYHRLAVIASQQKQWNEADRYFRKAYSAARPSSELLSDMGYYYYLRHRLDEAKQLSLRALQIDPKNTTAHNNLGLVYGEQGQYAQSLASFQRAVPAAEAHANLAFVLAQAGETERAISHYSQSLSLDGQLRASARAMMQLASKTPATNRVADSAPAQTPVVAEAVAKQSPSAALPAEPDYDAIAIDDAPRPDIGDYLSEQVAEAEVPRELVLPKSAPAKRMVPSNTTDQLAVAPRPAATIDLAEELAQYLEHTAMEAANRAPPQPTVDVKPTVVAATPQPAAIPRQAAPVPTPEPVAPPTVAAVTPKSVEPVAAPKPAAVQVQQEQVVQAPLVPPTPSPEQIAADKARQAKRQASKQYQPKRDTLDIDRVASDSGAYRPRSRIGSLRPTRQQPAPSTKRVATPQIVQTAATTPRTQSHMVRQAAVKQQAAKTTSRKQVAKQGATLDIDRLPEPSRWDRSQQPATAQPPKVSSRIAPRPVKEKLQPKLQPVPVAKLQLVPVAAPTIVNRSETEDQATTVRFVSGNPSHKKAMPIASQSAVQQASYQQPRGRQQKRQASPSIANKQPTTGSSIRFVPASE